jgi:hypothetical protein
MNHEQAANAALHERYLLGELSPAERDEFEEHFADCSRCLEDLRSFEAFRANMQAVFHDQAHAPEARARPLAVWWRRPWLFAFSGGLSFALATAALYAFIAIIPTLETEIRTLQAPAVAETFVIQGATRGAQSMYTAPSNSSSIFRLDLPRHFERYVCVLESSPDHTRKTYTLQVPQNTETLNLTIPLRALSPGDHSVSLSGYEGTKSEVLSTFVLRVTPGT